MHRTDARKFIALHGRAAHQHAVDRMPAALRAGDEDDARHFERVGQEIERLRHTKRT